MERGVCVKWIVYVHHAKTTEAVSVGIFQLATAVVMSQPRVISFSVADVEMDPGVFSD